MNDSISIRTATLNDLETLLQFEQGLIAAEKPLDPFLGKGKLYYYNIPEMITAQNVHLIVAVSNKELVASGYVRIENAKHYHKNPIHGYVGFIYVKPSFRGQKISNAILESLKSWAKNKDLNESLPLTPPFTTRIGFGVEKKSYWAQATVNLVSKQDHIAESFGETQRRIHGLFRNLSGTRRRSPRRLHVFHRSQSQRQRHDQELGVDAVAENHTLHAKVARDAEVDVNDEVFDVEVFE